MTWHLPVGREELVELLRDLPPETPLLPTGAPPAGGAGPGLAPAVEEALAAGTADVLSLAGTAGPVRVAGEDLTVTASAGTRVRELEARVAAAGQWLPLPAGSRGRSVGGLVAAGLPGRFDAAYGALGRQVLEVRLAGWDGTPFRWGRPVVKDVAGYDAVRLLCGSQGRAGVLTEVTFRTWPRPGRRRAFRLEARDGDGSGAPESPEAGRDADAAVRAAARLLGRDPGRDFRPDAATWRWRPAGGSACRVELLGTDASVEARSRRLAAWAEEAGVRCVETTDGGTTNDTGAGETGTGETEAGERATVDAAVDDGAAKEANGGAVDDGAAEAADGGAPARSPGRARVRLRPGARYLPAAMAAIPTIAGGRLLGAVADLQGGWLRLTLDAAGLDRDAAGRLLEALPGAGRAVAVERGPAVLHAAADAARRRDLRELEGRVLDALRGRSRHWLADFL